VRALVLPRFESTVELQNIEVPEPQAGEIRVKVSAASVNGFDLAVAAGYLNGMMEHRFPVVIGKDFAGTVDAIGADAEGFSIGDRVFGVVSKSHLGDGSFGEYVTIPVGMGVAPLPDSISFATAASLGLAGTAAVDALTAASLTADSVVLISGATGGVGVQAVQLAAQAGAHVIATARTAEAQSALTALGASALVDYTGDLAAQIHETHPDGVDVVLHFAGDASALGALVKPGGILVSAIGATAESVGNPAIAVTGVMATPTAETLTTLADHEESGRTSVAVQQVYSLDDAAAALSAFGAGKFGKLVISVA